MKQNHMFKKAMALMMALLLLALCGCQGAPNTGSSRGGGELQRNRGGSR